MPDENRDPISKTIRRRIEEKLRQCEEGIVSLIAVKTRYPNHESDLKNALFGAFYGVLVRTATDAEGQPLPDELGILRVDKAPFARKEPQAQGETQELADPFKKMSGVWHFPAYREDHPKALLNPSSTTPVSDSLAQWLSKE